MLDFLTVKWKSKSSRTRSVKVLRAVCVVTERNVWTEWSTVNLVLVSFFICFHICSCWWVDGKLVINITFSYCFNVFIYISVILMLLLVVVNYCYVDLFPWHSRIHRYNLRYLYFLINIFRSLHFYKKQTKKNVCSMIIQMQGGAQDIAINTVRPHTLFWGLY